MALIKSISGIRGTIGGKPGESLSPIDIVKFAAAFGTWLKRRHGDSSLSLIIGRDARKSGPMVSGLITTTLQSMGINVTDLGLATTPTVEMAVAGTGAHAGIIVTASHNPSEWNALKLLNEKGEFLSSMDGISVLEIAESENFEFVSMESGGKLIIDNTWHKRHIDMILRLDLVNTDKIKEADFSIALDCVNSVGGVILPDLLRALGVNNIHLLNSIPDGNFAHNPEPLPENLTAISEFVVKQKADLGFVVDPDVDRLAIICEDGSMFGEEYTLVSVADYILSHTRGNTVSNLSSTKALKDISSKYGCSHFSSAVGEVNVVDEMKRVNAVIGGEGNGGVIYPELHYGRDALVGISLFLSLLAVRKMSCSSLRKTYPQYEISKRKLKLDPATDFNDLLSIIKNRFKDFVLDERDGLWMGHPDGWVQIRKSNTEPIMRIYSEGRTEKEAGDMADRIIEIVNNV